MPIAEVNGGQLFYAEDDFVEIWRPHQTVFINHYTWGDHRDLRAWVPTLARDYRVIRLDRRGNGFSSALPVDEETMSIERILTDFIAFLDHKGIDQVHYIGTAFGGVLGAAFAATYPERVRSLVLCMTPCYLKQVAIDAFRVEGYKDGASAVLGMGSWAYFHTTGTVSGRTPSSDKERFIQQERLERASQLPPRTVAAAMRLYSTPACNITPLLSKIEAPTLLISPGDTVVTTAEEQEMMRATIPDCEQHILDGVPNEYHALEPDHCASLALDFIQRHS